jgi:hypothetical protein
MSLLKSFTHNFKGVGDCDSKCHIRIFEGAGRDSGMVVVIATQIMEDEGTSITNWAERLATEIAAREGISPNGLIWIEQYPEEKGRYDVESEEHYQRVVFKSDRGAFTDSEFYTLDRGDVEAMIGERLEVVSVDVDNPRTVLA